MDELDAAILEAARSLSGDAGVDAGDVGCAEVLDAVGGDQGECYARMVRLMDPVWLWFPLLEGIGYIGDRDLEPMWPTHVRCRIGAVGQGVLADPEHPAVLANGDLYRGGIRAPYAPGAVATALRRAAAQPATMTGASTDTAGGPDAGQRVALGSPAFPTGCRVEIELDDVRASELVGVTLCAQVSASVEADGRVVLLVRALPPGAGAWSMMQALTHRTSVRDVPVFARVEEVSPPGFDHASRLVLAESATEAAARTLIDQAPGMVQSIMVEPAQPAADRLVRWVAAHGPEEALQAADQLDGPWQVSGEKLARRTSPITTGS